MSTSHPPPPGKLRGIWGAEETRRKIQATQLINRLQACAMGEVELTREQVRAIEILLRKSVPDLSAVSIEGNLSGAFTITWPVGRHRLE